MTDQGRTAAKYIQKIQAGRVGVLAFSASGANDVITTALTTALITAGHGGTAVPLQVSAGVNGEGVVATTTLNRVSIRIDEAPVDDGTGLEVYARITEATGAYTVTYYVNDGGTETAHSFGPATDIDLYIPYRYTFGSYPGDSLIAIPAFDATPNPAAITVPTAFIEELPVTATNTITNLSNTPIGGVNLFCGGVSFASVESPAPFTISGQAITWSASNAGVTLETTDTVVASYSY
jgi:hypothetical protein